jgi:hypothetical protein
MNAFIALQKNKKSAKIEKAFSNPKQGLLEKDFRLPTPLSATTKY